MANHYIIVENVDQDGSIPDWSIEHPADCPTIEIYHGVTDYSCEVGREISSAGLTAFGTWEEWPDSIPRETGRYPIEFWEEEHSTPYYGSEYDSGLRVVNTMVEGGETS